MYGSGVVMFPTYILAQVLRIEAKSDFFSSVGGFFDVAYNGVHPVCWSSHCSNHVICNHLVKSLLV